MKQRNTTGLRRTLAYSASALACAAMALSFAAAPADAADEAQMKTVEQAKSGIPQPPWPKGDERGMANTLGAGTWARCAYHLAAAGAKSYELSHERSNTMPLSPFGVPLQYEFNPSVSIPGTKHVFNGEKVISGEPGAQGTQMDALGHFAYYDKAWGGDGVPPVGGAKYYGDYTQKEVKPAPEAPLQKLGIEKVPPIVTTAVLLDAKTHLGKGKAMEAGQMVTAADIKAMLKAQGLDWRGIQAGDVVYIYTGWGDNWADPDDAKSYYGMGPGLSEDGAKLLEESRVVLVALDNPFTDPVAEGQLQQKAKPPQGMDKGLPFVIHHQNLTQAGIHNIQNANLGELAKAKVWTSCTMILPLRSRGHSGSPVRPVAIGAPDQ